MIVTRWLQERLYRLTAGASSLHDTVQAVRLTLKDLLFLWADSICGGEMHILGMQKVQQCHVWEQKRLSTHLIFLLQVYGVVGDVIL